MDKKKLAVFTASLENFSDGEINRIMQDQSARPFFTNIMVNTFVL